MLNRVKKNNDKGFTIIEVMIVLAIAALILLIVFLAVPALQRNSRNTNRKSDVGRVGSASVTVVSNGNGAMASLTTANVRAEVGNRLGYYEDTGVTANAVLAAGGTVTNATTIDTIVVVPNAACAGANAAFANRQIAVLYSTEAGGGGPTRACLDQ